MREIWETIKGYTGYKVSNKGRIKSFKHSKTEGKIKVLRRDKDGYLTVGLCEKGIPKTHKAHRLEAIAFIPNPKKKPFVNHINGIKDDNRLPNLEWNTQSENEKHAYALGLKNQKGVLNANAKLNPSKVRQIRRLLARGIFQKDIAKQYKVEQTTIGFIKRKVTWKHVR